MSFYHGDLRVQVQLTIAVIPAALPFLKSGKLKGWASPALSKAVKAANLRRTRAYY